MGLNSILKNISTNFGAKKGKSMAIPGEKPIIENESQNQNLEDAIKKASPSKDFEDAIKKASEQLGGDKGKSKVDVKPSKIEISGTRQNDIEIVLVEILKKYVDEINLFVPHQTTINLQNKAELTNFISYIVSSTHKLQPVESKYASVVIPIGCCMWAKGGIIANGVFTHSSNLNEAKKIVSKAADSFDIISNLTVYSLESDRYKICIIDDTTSKQSNLSQFEKYYNEDFEKTIFLFERKSYPVHNFDQLGGRMEIREY